MVEPAPRILLGVTGCVGAFKAVLLLRLMKKAGWEVRVVLTDAAREFVGEATFHALSGRPVSKDLWELDATEGGELHVELSEWADAMIVYPATANFLAGVAAGLGDDLLRLTALCFSGPQLLCPAMHTRMHDNPLHQQVLEKLRGVGIQVLPSVAGELASGEFGAGRLPEPEDALAALAAMLSPADLAGRRFLVTAGPTREPLDAVRYLSNPSTGRMGYAIAVAAARRGADVTLVSGPTSLRIPQGVKLVSVETAAEMAGEVHRELDEADVVVMTAAVADYRPAQPVTHKLKKTGDSLRIELEPTEDILGGLRKRGFEGILVGFAMETEDLVNSARDKLQSKGLDLVVANDLTVEGAGFAGETNVVTIVNRSGKAECLQKMSKAQVASCLLDRITPLFR